MSIGFNNLGFRSSLTSKVSFQAKSGKFDFDNFTTADLIEFSKTDNSPNSVDLVKRKYFGPKRIFEPNFKELKVFEAAAGSPETKGAWKGFFRSVVTAWKQVLK